MSGKFRHKLTEEEAILWTELKAFRNQGFAFRRQVKLSPFRVDFLCSKAKLIVEADGNHHGYSDQHRNHDQGRDEWLRLQVYAILRIWNHDIRTNLTNLSRQIENLARSRL